MLSLGPMAEGQRYVQSASPKALRHSYGWFLTSGHQTEDGTVKITILCDSPFHPVMDWMKKWQTANVKYHEIDIIIDKAQLSSGHILFLISCGQIITKGDRDRYKKTLVIHAADLPRGRGWSPHIWQLIEGKTSFMLTMLEAEDKVDSGDIWHQIEITVPKHFLYDEINRVVFDGECHLMDWALENFDSVKPRKQIGEPTYYPKRTPKDSELDVSKSIAEQFDLMRISDPDRYPAFLNNHGYKYKLIIEKI